MMAMKVTEALFIKSASLPSQFPLPKFPEVAFVGRSNVGKSSLINTLAGRQGLARISKAPGCTQLINFFKINNFVYFVDLPGYGYAQVSKETREKWGPMVEGYLKNRETLRLVVFLLDIRRDPDESDTTMLKWLEFYSIPYIVVLTKCDKFTENEINLRRQRLLSYLPVKPSEIINFSAKTKRGRETIWAEIKKFVSEKDKRLDR